MDAVRLSLLVTLVIQGVCSLTITMNQNIEGLLGPSNVQINCSFVIDDGDTVFLINLKTSIDGQFKSIVTFSTLGLEPAFLPDGEYLRNRAILMNPTGSDPTATLTFNETVCEDENEYLCEINYQDGATGDTPSPLPSTSTNLTVRAAAEKPENPPEISGVNGSIVEGLNVTFICSGNIGNPPGKFIWERFRGIGFFPITYKNEPTTIEQGRVDCTNNGTSTLTISMEDGDHNGFIRCVIEQEFASSKVYQQSPFLSVKYSVRGTDITRTPDQLSYIEGSEPITLWCYGAGNPMPTFAWYREDNDTILSNAPTLVINDVIVENGGSYICISENTIESVTYNESATTNIIIGPNITSMTTAPSTEQTTMGVVVQDSGTKDNMAAIIGGSLGAVVAIAISIVICKKAFKKKDKYEGPSQGQITHFENTNVPPSSTHVDMYSSLYKSESRISKL